MSAKAIYEAKGKQLLNDSLEGASIKNKFAVVREDVNWGQLVDDNPWLTTEVSILITIFYIVTFKYII